MTIHPRRSVVKRNDLDRRSDPCHTEIGMLSMFREIRSLQVQLEIGNPVLLLMAREAAADSRLRCVEELTSTGARILLADLREMARSLLLPAAA